MQVIESKDTETFAGGLSRLVDLAAPKLGASCWRDIGEALANINRYNGQLGVCTVAEHSCRVADFLLFHGDKRIALHGLLHDAHEAYMGDITRPVQAALELLHPGTGAAIEALKARLDKAVYDALGMPMPTDADRDMIAEADVAVALDERSTRRRFWRPVEADLEFARRGDFFTKNLLTASRA